MVMVSRSLNNLPFLAVQSSNIGNCNILSQSSFSRRLTDRFINKIIKVSREIGLILVVKCFFKHKIMKSFFIKNMLCKIMSFKLRLLLFILCNSQNNKFLNLISSKLLNYMLISSSLKFEMIELIETFVKFFSFRTFIH